MANRYIGRNINIFLIIIIIISIGSLVVISTYYNQRYQVISKDYNNLQQNLRSNVTELINTKNELSTLKARLNESSIDIERYEDLYTNTRTELDTTAESLSRTRQELDKTKIELIDSTNKLREEQTRAVNLQSQLNACNAARIKAEKEAEEAKEACE
ncbi:MAG: hypothetical protein ACMXYG_06625 [Candidatus Woesearchaeota archaeon]